MASSSRRWEKTATRKFEELLMHPDFIKRIEDLKTKFNSEDDIVTIQDYYEVTQQFKLPRPCIVMIRAQVQFGDYHLAEKLSPIFLLSTADDYAGPTPELPFKTYWDGSPPRRVMLELTSETQKQDIYDFVRTNWKLIESKLTLLNPERVKAVKLTDHPDFDAEVLRLKESGMKVEAIAAKYNTNNEYIKTILKRSRKYRNQNEDFKKLF